MVGLRFGIPALLYALRTDESLCAGNATALPAEPAATHVCQQLYAAYAAALPIPLPPPGLSIVPAVAIGICCPEELLERLRSSTAARAAAGAAVRAVESAAHTARGVRVRLAGTARERQAFEQEHFRALEEQELADFIKMVAPDEKLSDDELHAQAEDRKRTSIMDEYDLLSTENRLRNAKTLGGKLLAGIRHTVGKHSDPRFSAVNYGETMAARSQLEQKYPWVLYPRLLESYMDERLSMREKLLFVDVMTRLKEQEPWLPDLPVALQASAELLFGEELAAVKAALTPAAFTQPEVSAIPSRGRVAAVLAGIQGDAERTRQRLCGYIGRVSAPLVRRMEEAVAHFDRPSEFELEELAQKVTNLHISGGTASGDYAPGMSYPV